MTPSQVLTAVETIAATSSIKSKQELLQSYIGDAFFRDCMVAAYNPLVTYGLHVVPTGAHRGEEGWSLSEPHVWVTLSMLAERHLTGDEARNHVQMLMDKLDKSSATLLWRILRKDMRAGFGDTLLNKVSPGLIPEFPYMRCSLEDKSDMSKWDWSVGVISQVKADGMFANVNHEDGGNVSISSRQGSAFPLDELQGLVADIKSTLTEGTQTHGELLVYDGPLMLPREQGNGILNSLLQGGKLPEGHRVVFFAWDQIPLAAVKPKGKYERPYKERLLGLVNQMATRNEGSVKLIETRVVRQRSQAFDHYRECLRKGLEGTIVKHPNAIWKDGTSKEQVKLKLQVDVDLMVVGFVPGEGKNAATFGSIECRTLEGKLRVDVSGFTDAVRLAVHANRDAHIGKIMTVRANSVMAPSEPDKPYSLFLPRFVEFREDKTIPDSLEEVQSQFRAAVSA